MGMNGNDGTPSQEPPGPTALGPHLGVAGKSIAHRFLHGSFWSLVGAVGSTGVTAITFMVLARVLGKASFGRFTLVQSTLSMVGVFAGFGIGTVATRYAAALKLRDPQRLGRILALSERTVLGFGLLASLVLTLTAPWMANHLYKESALALPLAGASLTVLFATADGFQKCALIGLESTRAFAIGAVSASLVAAPILVLAAQRFGITGAALGLAAGAAIQASISHIQMLRELRKLGIRIAAKGCSQEMGLLWDFALPALLAGALVGPTQWLAQTMLANSPQGFAEVAVLGVAMQWFNLILFLPGTAGRVMLPILTDHLAGGERHKARRILLIAIGSYGLVALPLAALVAWLAPRILNLYGAGFSGDTRPLIFAVMTACLVAIQTPVGAMIAAANRMWLGSLMNLGWATAYIAIAYQLRSHGAAGVIVAMGIAYLLHATWTFWFAFHSVWPTLPPPIQESL